MHKFYHVQIFFLCKDAWREKKIIIFKCENLAKKKKKKYYNYTQNQLLRKK